MSDPMSFAPDTNYEDHEFMRMALRRDVVAICEDCTAIYMMSNWERSKGANAELGTAKALGLDVYYEAHAKSKERTQMKEMKPQYIYKATVTKVVDGDVDLLVDCGFNIIRKERIRFYGVDAWETRGRARAWSQGEGVRPEPDPSGD